MSDKLKLYFLGLLGGFTICALGGLLPEARDTILGKAATLLFDKGNNGDYPFSIQNFMWLAFGVSIADLYHRTQQIKVQAKQLLGDFLPSEPERLLRSKDLWLKYQNSSNLSKDLYFAKIIKRCAYQFKVSNSIEQTHNVLESTIENISSELELQYSNIRYLVWFIPTLGFIGTVYGILKTLSGMDVKTLEDTNALVQRIDSLGVAFNTTLLALIMSAILVLALHLIQEREERVLNDTHEYFLDRLINKLIVVNG